LTWSEEEDLKILLFVELNGTKNWKELSKRLDNRSCKECRERWHDFLDPSIKNIPWSPEEDAVFFILQQQMENCWA
jgi:hypothetical protein